MEQKIIMPTYKVPPLSSFSVFYDQVGAISETILNSPIAKASESLANSFSQINKMFDASGFVEMQKKQQEFVSSIHQLTFPLGEAMQSIINGLQLHTFVFPPVEYDGPQKTYQQPSADLPEYKIEDGVGILYFKGEAITVGNANTQPAKAVQYMCGNLNNAINYYTLFTYCKNPNRGKYTSRVEHIDMETRIKRGRDIIRELYKINGFKKVFTLSVRNYHFTPKLMP